MTATGLGLLVLRNLLRRPTRNLLLATSVFMVVAMQISAAMIDRSAHYGLQLGVRRMGADMVAVPRGTNQAFVNAYLTGETALRYMDRDVEERIRRLPYVESTSAQLHLRSLSKAACCTVWDMFLIAFDPETDFVVRPWLRRHNDMTLGPDDVLAGAMAADALRGEVRFFGHAFRVAGVLEPSGLGLDQAVFIPFEGASRMAHDSETKAVKPLAVDLGKISAVMINIKKNYPPLKAFFEIQRAVPEVSILFPEEIKTRVEHNLSMTLKTLRISSYSVWPIAVVLIGLVFAAAVRERRREIGLLRAMGATRGFVFRMIMSEAFIVTGAGALLGISLSVALVMAFADYLAIKLEISFYLIPVSEILKLALLAFSAALFFAAAAALLPAIQASRKEPYEAIRRGE
jgi:putative ABC transport system permease protein